MIISGGTDNKNILSDKFYYIFSGVEVFINGVRKGQSLSEISYELKSQRNNVTLVIRVNINS